MPTRHEILKDIKEYSAQQIAEVIKRGELTMYELKATGMLTPLMKRKLEMILDGEETQQVMSSPATETPVETPAEIGATENADADDADEWVSWEDDADDRADYQPGDMPPVPEDSENEATAEVLTALPDEDEELPALPEEEDEPVTPCEPTEEDIARDDVPDISYEGLVDPKLEKEPFDNSGIFKMPWLPRGRIGRLEFILSIIIAMLGYLLSIYIEKAGWGEVYTWSSIGIFAITSWFLVCQTARRCHDINIRGWIMLTIVFPIALIFIPGNNCVNRFGTMPVA